MNFSAFCIRRPAFTIVISLLLTVIGLISFSHLPVRWIPNVSLPEISINTAYSGANAKVIERDVTKVIENALSGINGIDTLTSISRQGASRITINFKLGTNMDAALEDVRSGIEKISGNLPQEASTPIVNKTDPDNMPLLLVTFYHPKYSARALSDYVDKFVVPTFEALEGMGNVTMFGKRVTALRIWLDPAKMAAAKVTAEDIIQLLRAHNASIATGQIRSADRFYSVNIEAAIKTPADLEQLIIQQNGHQITRLREVANIVYAPENVDSAFRVNGKPAVALGFIPQSTANPLKVADEVESTLITLKPTLPTGMTMNVAYNQADYIRASIKSVYESFFEAVIFVWLVILFFLGSIRATFIPIITIPVCMIGTCALLYFLNFSINTITLMAFVLAIGLVVDDAIVMVENINRHIEAGMSAFDAAIKGSAEMFFPIIAMTLTLSAVYLPIAFTSGTVGVLFKEFTFALAGAVIISGIVALSLSPMMCARILKKPLKHDGYLTWLQSIMTALQMNYQAGLNQALSFKKTLLGIVFLLIGLGAIAFWRLPAEFAPAEDMSEINVFVAAPRTASFHYTDHYVQQLERLYANEPDISFYISQSGSFSPVHAWQVLRLKPKSERHAPLETIITQLTEKASTITGVKVNVFPPSPPLAEVTGSDSGDRLGFAIMTTQSDDILQALITKLKNKIQANKYVSHIDNRLKWDSEQFQINIDNERAADLHVPQISITNTLSTLLAGREVGKANDANILVQLNPPDLANPNIFGQLYTRNESGEMVSLANLLTVNLTSSPAMYTHYNRLRSDTIYVTLATELKLSTAITILESFIQQNLPENFKYTFVGEAKSFLEAKGKTLFTFLLALVFIYLVLVAQFESFIDPLIIIFTVPLALVGAIFSLKLFGGSMNIYSNIGLITLVGLIAKHGILITDFANQLRRQGKSIQKAVISASLMRLRPILMTTCAMVLGALPLAIASGPGAESRQQIGLVIAGGLFFGTFFSLFIVPLAYTLLAPFSAPSLK